MATKAILPDGHRPVAGSVELNGLRPCTRPSNCVTIKRPVCSRKEDPLATQFEVTPTTGPEPGLGPISPIADTESARRLDRLAPLLPRLIAWDLVRQTDTGGFEIPEDVQERLRRLSALQNGSIAEVYVGRKCGRCGSMRVTRMVDGVR